MSENEVGRKEATAFEPIPNYERLLDLRRASPDAFMLQTSEATRRALHYYERQKVGASVSDNPATQNV